MEKTIINNTISEMITGLPAIALLGAFFSTSADACTVPSGQRLNPTTALEYNLPLNQPAFRTVGTCVTMWPYDIRSVDDALANKIVALSPPPPGALAPMWESGKVYTAGQVASYNARNFKALWWTLGDTPGAANGAWQELGDAYGNPPVWSTTIAYAGGSKVTYNGNIYSAKWWTQAEVPGPTSAVWALVGPIGPKLPASFVLTVKEFVSPNSSWTTDVFQLANYSRADNWKLNLNGVTVQKGTTINTTVTPCPTGSPASCAPTYKQSGVLAIPVNRADQVTFWLCTGTICRSTPRITWEHNPTPTPTPAPTPTPMP